MKIKFLLCIYILLLHSGCAFQSSYSLLTESQQTSGSLVYAELKNELDNIIAAQLAPGTIASIKVVSLKDERTVYETNAELLLTPASLQKLFTAAAALSLLGFDHVMETSISISPDYRTLYLYGCGDPLLKTSDLSSMVDTIVEKLPTSQSYNLTGENGCFDEIYWGKGWMWDDEPAPETMYISPLSVNGNTIVITVRPGNETSSPVVISTDPSIDYVTVESDARTLAAGGACSLSIKRAPGDRENRITIRGTLGLDCQPISKKLALWKPELYTLKITADLLENNWLKVESASIGAMPAGNKKLAVIRRSLKDIIELMLKTSDNLSAENLIKYLSHAKSGKKGSTADGLNLLREYLSQNGIKTEQLVFADGSGVSRYNLTSAAAVTRLLVAAYKDQSISEIFVNALPVAGRDGTLEYRMQKSAAKGNVMAKTGSLAGVSTLAGYATAKNGETLAFTMIMQNFAGSAERIRNIQDRILHALLSFAPFRHDAIEQK